MADLETVKNQLWKYYEGTLGQKWDPNLKNSTKIAELEAALNAKVGDWRNWRDATLNCLEAAAATALVIHGNQPGAISIATFDRAIQIVRALWGLDLLDRKGAPGGSAAPGALC
jgi:hypothetical protein